MIARRLSLMVIASLCALTGLLMVAAVSAHARVTHIYLPGLSEKLSEDIPATGPHGEAIPLPGVRTLEPSASLVDSGHLWVFESTPEFRDARIDEYDASTGEFMGQIAHTHGGGGGLGVGLAVGHTGGEGLLYTTAISEGHYAVFVYNEAGALKGTWTGSGTPAGSFSNATSIDIAVDNSTDPLDERKGDVYLADGENHVVDIFHPEADGKEHYVGQITGTSPTEPFRSPTAVAVNEVNGDVIVKDQQKVDVLEPTALGEYVLSHQISGTPSGLFSAGSNVLAAGGGSGDIYVDDSVARRGSQGEVLSSEVVVDQFSASGVFLGQFAGADTPHGGFEDLYSLAIDQESRVYATEESTPGSFKGGRVDAFGGEIVFPDVTPGSPSNVTSFTATLNGTVNPDDAGAAACRFEWGSSESLGNVALCEPEGVPDGGSPVPVHTTLSGLQTDTTYFYRLQATNGNGTNAGEASQDQEFTTPGPGFHDTSVTDLASTSVTFHADIDPHGVSSSYYFQYGTSTNYEADVPAPPGEAIGGAEGDVEVTPHHVQGLQPNTVYHYRVVVVAEPKPGEVVVFDGPDRVFTTQGGAVSELPDGRQWEMVSPPDKRGALIRTLEVTGVMRAANDGSAISYLADVPTEAEPQGNALDSQVLSRRGAGGWTSNVIALPHSNATGASIGNGEEYRLFSADLSQAVVQPAGNFLPGLSAEASEATAMLRTLSGSCGSSCFRPLVTGKPGYANVPAGTVFGQEPNGECERLFCGPNFIAATPDLSHVILSIEGERAGEAGLGQFEWSGGTLTPIDVLPGNASGGIFTAPNDPRGAISSDGSHVVLTEPQNGNIYMRDLSLKKTVQLNDGEASCVAEGQCAGGAGSFQLASSDGSKVFFDERSAGASAHRLTKDAGHVGSDLYECEVAERAGELECRLSDIAKEAVGVLGASEDGSYLYFVANSVLAEGAVPGECEKEGVTPSVGATCNLYVRHGNVTKLVALLSVEDRHDWETSLSALSARVSPNGNWVEFMSQRPVTGYDNRDAASGKLDAEVYLYGASTGHVVCASCDPTGARPTGAEYNSLEPANGGLTGGPGETWNSGGWVAANVPGWLQYRLGSSADQPRYLSDSGRLFFDSGDALVPQDVNGTQDVYEYEPAQDGSCTTASATFSEGAGGCVGLISSGTSAAESAFLDASESGGDVFFLTYSRLQPQDYDNALDVYDAHECTSASPCIPAPAATPPACTTAEACRAAPTPQPASFGAPSSATFSGAGNIATGTGGVATAKSLTRAQKLAGALKGCEKKPRKRRARCKRRARAQYGQAKHGPATRKKGKR